MISIQNRQKLWNLLQDFHKISGIRVGVFDSDSRELAACPKQGSLYCAALKSVESCRSACLECDRAAYRQASLTKDVHIYRCHAGLIEAVVPIRNHGLSYGYLMIGQLRPVNESDSQRGKRLTYLRDLGLDTDALSALYKKLPALSTEQINAYAHILQACANFVWMEDYIQLQEAPLSYRAEVYIQNHLEENITLAKLADFFKVGKTTLCNTIKEETGYTVLELIRSIRIGEAKKLLQANHVPISEIAAQVGIADYNYFSKVFKQATGQTPSNYRQAHGQDHLS